MPNESSKPYRWIEIAVAAIVVILLAAIVAPAILASREEARRHRCEANLRSLSLGVLNYVDANQFYPLGTVGSRELTSQQRFSWYVTLWYFIEGKPPQLLVDTNQAWDAEINQSPHFREAVGRWRERTVDRPLDYLPLFSCPSASQNLRVQGIQVTQYVGIAGLGANAPELAIGDEGVGIWGYDRRVTTRAITDGIAETILYMETAHELGPWLAGGPPTVRGLDTTAAPFIGVKRQVGGLHSTATSAMADGSVRQMSPEIDVKVLKALITIAGGDKP